ncbi:MAG: SO2930 family diheme c-type cytochrome [Sphingorhabdus sp.]
MRLLLAAVACLALAVSVKGKQAEVNEAAISAPANPALLSEFGFFNGGADKPAAGLLPYALRTPLFSDYSEKQRFLYLPPGKSYSIDADGRLQFPVGSALIKSFGYQDATGKLTIIETRLLLHRDEGWVALPYVWKADGSDAELKLGGARKPVEFTKPDGAKMAISYAVPNKNQCKQCHSTKDAITPIGPVWQNLAFESQKARQAFEQRGSGTELALGSQAKWDDLASGPVTARALSYLRVNCGHCHKPNGSASNSGLFFDGHSAGGAALGVGKRPVAAGRGSGNLDFVIDPGHPERSILIHRMKSTDPGIAMPELGRAATHNEGVKLLEEWIAGMK